MKRIGLLSDTHGYWDSKYEKYFSECDEIWHAGDIGTVEVAEKLAAIKPLRAVYGNIDGGDLRKMFSEKYRFKCEEVEVLIAASLFDGLTSEYYSGVIHRVALAGELDDVLVVAWRLARGNDVCRDVRELVNPTAADVSVGMLFHPLYLCLETLRLSNVVSIHAGYKVVGTVSQTFV